MTDDPAAKPPVGMSRRKWRGQRSSSTLPSPKVVSTDRPLTILTVCTGNICRSPMAEMVLRARLEPLGVRIQSAGTHALVGHEMTEPAQALAVEAGARREDTAAHTARFLIEPMLLSADLVLTMTREHRSHAVKMVPGHVRRTFTVREFARLASIISTDDARAAADAAGTQSRPRFATVVRAISDQRGHTLGGADPIDDDVIDPYRRSQEIYAQASAQLFPALDEVERIARAALD